MRWFVLQAVDRETKCAAFEARFAVDDISTLREIIGNDAERDAELRHVYPLDDSRLASIADRFGATFDGGDRDVLLVPWHRLRELPYLVHTGFELPLMLEGRKPFAFFIDQAEWLAEYLSPFVPFVSNGQIVRKVVEHSEMAPGLVSVCFALPGQEWRIDAYIDLRARGAKSGWSEAMDRQLGSLLGYSEWEKERWAEWEREIEIISPRSRPDRSARAGGARRPGRS